MTTNENPTCSTRAAKPRVPLFHPRGGAARSTFPLARRSRAFQAARGFTLVELLLVVAIIGLLAGLLFSAVFGVTRRAHEKRNENNRKLFQAAIVEYRHDVGKWPIPDADAAATKAELQEYNVAGTAKTRKGVVWKLTYGAVDRDGNPLFKNNDVIVEYLLNGKVGSKETKKRYLDLRPFLTTGIKTQPGFHQKYPMEDAVSADEVNRNGSKEQKEGKNIPLVYRSQFVMCPVCGTLQTETDIRSNQMFCKNGWGCHDTEAHPDDEEGEAPPHTFTQAELKSRSVDGVMPYKVTFDFVNNTCSVDM